MVFWKDDGKQSSTQPTHLIYILADVIISPQSNVINSIIHPRIVGIVVLRDVLVPVAKEPVVCNLCPKMCVDGEPLLLGYHGYNQQDTKIINQFWRKDLTKDLEFNCLFDKAISSFKIKNFQ